MRDIETARDIARVFLIIAAICTTAFCVLYAFSPWYRSHLGRAVMIQTASVASAMDISVFFIYKARPTNLLTALIINVGILAFISIGSLYLIGALFYYNFRTKEKEDAEREPAGHAGDSVPE